MAGRKESQELFQLIKSMTPEEKGYFKKFSGRHGSESAVYHKLFDEISSQDAYDEKPMKKKFKNFAIQKVYLLEVILNSILAGNSDNHLVINTMKQALKARILKDRGLYNTAEAKLKRLIDSAREQSDYWLESDLLRTYYWVRKNRLPATEKLSAVIDTMNQIHTALTKLGVRDEIVKAQNVLAIVKDIKIFDESYQHNWETSLNIALLEKDFVDESLFQFIYRKIALSDYYDVTGNLQQAFEHLKQAAAKAMEERKKGKDKWISAQLAEKSLLFTIPLACRLYKINEAKKLLADVKPLLKQTDNSTELYCYYLYAELNIFYSSGKHKEGQLFCQKYFTKEIAALYKKTHTKFYITLFTLQLIFEFSYR